MREQLKDDAEDSEPDFRDRDPEDVLPEPLPAVSPGKRIPDAGPGPVELSLPGAPRFSSAHVPATRLNDRTGERDYTWLRVANAPEDRA